MVYNRVAAFPSAKRSAKHLSANCKPYRPLSVTTLAIRIMFPLDVNQLPGYLRSRHLLGSNEPCRVEALSGGVSNVVLRVEPEGRPAFVVKQSREQLRTEAPWFSRLDRIFGETGFMRAVRPLLPEGAIPRILDEDRENYAYAMEAVDATHVVWKLELLSRRVREAIALRLAQYLAGIHGGTHANPVLAEEFDDREVFVQLRVDPFYRHVARVHGDLRQPIEALIDEMWQTRLCLVHADFSPKNVLIVDRPPRDGVADGPHDAASQPIVTLVDFETGHYGDPAFDLGFFLSHLLLKAVRTGGENAPFLRLAATFLDRYREEIVAMASGSPLITPELEHRAVKHLAACSLARIDGTSPVDYLTDAADRDLVRAFSRRLLQDSVNSLPVAFDILGLALADHPSRAEFPATAKS
jgi:5-methylthioribose kinase